jgi:3-oxoacyl-[acyl-carrier protein] reductase
MEADLADPTTAARPVRLGRGPSSGPSRSLVNNATTARLDTFVAGEGQSRPRTSNRHYEVNARAPALLIAELASRCKSGLGRSSTSRLTRPQARPNEVSYWATKHMLESLSRSAALELAPLGVTVNTVCPGPTQTGWISPELEERVLRRCLRKARRAEDVAVRGRLLCSEQARWLTGQTLYAGGRPLVCRDGARLSRFVGDEASGARASGAFVF